MDEEAVDLSHLVQKKDLVGEVLVVVPRVGKNGCLGMKTKQTKECPPI